MIDTNNLILSSFKDGSIKFFIAITNDSATTKTDIKYDNSWFTPLQIPRHKSTSVELYYKYNY